MNVGHTDCRASDFRFSLFLLLLADFAAGVVTGAVAIFDDAAGEAGPSAGAGAAGSATEASTLRNSRKNVDRAPMKISWRWSVR